MTHVLIKDSNLILGLMADKYSQCSLNGVRRGDGCIIEFEVDNWFHEMVMDVGNPR